MCHQKHFYFFNWLNQKIQMLSSISNPGVRQISIYEIIMDSLPKNLTEDKEVTDWVNSLKADPMVKIISCTTKELNHYLRTTLSVTSSLVNTALYPITKPVSKIVKDKKITLEQCPFQVANNLNISGNGELCRRKLGFFDNFRLSIKNLMNSSVLSNNVVLRKTFALSEKVLNIPIGILSEPSKENMVMFAIQKYYPDFNIGKFTKWLEDNFLPCFMSDYIKGSLSLKNEAEVNIVQERQMQIANYVSSRMIVKSKLLSVYDVDVMNFDFKGGNPMVQVKCSADYIEHITDRNHKTVIGAPDNILKIDVLVSLTINNSGNAPVWKANEISIGSQCTRI